MHELHEHFALIGTLLASGSDDLKVVILDWIRSKTFISFESGHRANVFQVSHCFSCNISRSLIDYLQKLPVPLS